VTLNMALVSMSFGATFSFIAVKLEAIAVGPVLIGVAFGMESLSSGISQPFLGRLADRFDRRLLVAGGLVVSASVLAGVGLVNSLGPVMLLLLGLGVGNSIAMVAGGALQIVAGRRAGMGTVIGLGSAGNGAGIVFGSVAGGVFVDQFGLDATFFFGGAAMLAGVPLFLFLTRGMPTREEEVPPMRPKRPVDISPPGVLGGDVHPGGGV
jgi:MFS family permease